MQTEAELDVGAAGRAQRDGLHPLNRPPRKRAPHRLSMAFGDHGQSSSVEHTCALTTLSHIDGGSATCPPSAVRFRHPR